MSDNKKCCCSCKCSEKPRFSADTVYTSSEFRRPKSADDAMGACFHPRSFWAVHSTAKYIRSLEQALVKRGVFNYDNKDLEFDP